MWCSRTSLVRSSNSNAQSTFGVACINVSIVLQLKRTIFGYANTGSRCCSSHAFVLDDTRLHNQIARKCGNLHTLDHSGTLSQTLWANYDPTSPTSIPPRWYPESLLQRYSQHWQSTESFETDYMCDVVRTLNNWSAFFLTIKLILFWKCLVKKFWYHRGSPIVSTYTHCKHTPLDWIVSIIWMVASRAISFKFRTFRCILSEISEAETLRAIQLEELLGWEIEIYA